jgi:RNA polymerase sigma-70 factor (sigma-E family)
VAFVEGIGVADRPRLDRDERVVQLFDRHYTPLCRLAFMILGDAALAEEIVMEAMLKTFTGWGRIRDLDRTDAYLRRTVVNLCRSRIRRKSIEGRVNRESYRRDELKPPSWDPERHETSRLVWEAVKDLPERQRACIVLRYMEDLSDQQIADTLDIAVGTVKSQLSKARVKLERDLAPMFAGGKS